MPKLVSVAETDFKLNAESELAERVVLILSAKDCKRNSFRVKEIRDCTKSVDRIFTAQLPSGSYVFWVFCKKGNTTQAGINALMPSKNKTDL